MTFTVTTGARYRAVLSLSFFEKFASNATITAKLTDAGFTGVIVTGSGSDRIATGEWGGATTSTELPSQVVHVAVMP